jgi:hypothetical protein
MTDSIIAVQNAEKGMNEGCGLVECVERGNECINRITTDDVLDACREILASHTQIQRKSADEIKVTVPIGAA